MKKVLVNSAVLLSTLLACSKDNNSVSGVSATDKDFMVKASYFTVAEISAGEIAGLRGEAPYLPLFGAMMITDYSTAENTLDSIAAILSIDVPSVMDSAHQANSKILLTLSAHTFDTTYINDQVIDHKAAIDIFNKEISSGNNVVVKAFAVKTLPTIETHYQEALTTQAHLH